MTHAERVSAVMGHDGANFHTDMSLENLMACFGPVEVAHRAPFGTVSKFILGDGSAIIIAGDCWDLALDDSDPDCFCMKGNKRHNDDCHAS